MSESHFFLKSHRLQGVESCTFRERPLIAIYPELMDTLARHCGRPATTLFAEPILSPNGPAEAASIAWYSQHQGIVLDYSSLDDPGKEAIAVQLRKKFEEFAPAFADPDYGEALRMAFDVPTLSDVLAVGNKPVLINWGFRPSNPKASSSALSGPGMLAALVPAIAIPQPEAEILHLPPLSPPNPIEDVGSVRLNEQLATTVGTLRLVPPAPWRSPSIALLVLALIVLGVFGLHFLPKELLPFLRPEPGTPEATLDLQREINSSLEARIRAVKRSTEDAACRLGDPPALPIRNGANLPTAPIPVAPRTQASGVPAPPGSVDELLARLDQSTVLVMAIDDNKTEHGTGFFISDKLLVTNQHVVSDLVSPKFYVTNVELGGLVEAQLVAKTPSSNFFSPDFAVLEIHEGKGTPLELAEGAKRLETVIAAGFPGFLMQTDAAFKRMLDGDRSAVPQMAVTQGIVTARQTGPSNLAVLAHTAEISPGNSGGPLVDKCGHVIGVNTFFRADKSTATRANFALEASGLRAFLKDKNIAFKVSEGACVREALVPPPAGQTALPDSAPNKE